MRRLLCILFGLVMIFNLIGCDHSDTKQFNQIQSIEGGTQYDRVIYNENGLSIICTKILEDDIEFLCTNNMEDDLEVCLKGLALDGWIPVSWNTTEKWLELKSGEKVRLHYSTLLSGGDTEYKFISASFEIKNKTSGATEVIDIVDCILGGEENSNKDYQGIDVVHENEYVIIRVEGLSAITYYGSLGLYIENKSDKSIVYENEGVINVNNELFDVDLEKKTIPPHSAGYITTSFKVEEDFLVRKKNSYDYNFYIYTEYNQRELFNITSHNKENVYDLPESKTNECIVDGCSKEGIHEIIGISGLTEYYCGSHFEEMKSTLEMMFEDTSSNSGVEVTDEDIRIVCWSVATDAVKSKLKYPLSADFPFSCISEDVSITQFGNTYYVSSWVKAENDFKQEIKYEFQVEIKREGTTFIEVDCQFYE